MGRGSRDSRVPRERSQRERYGACGVDRRPQSLHRRPGAGRPDHAGGGGAERPRRQAGVPRRAGVRPERPRDARDDAPVGGAAARRSGTLGAPGGDRRAPRPRAPARTPHGQPGAPRDRRRVDRSFDYQRIEASLRAQERELGVRVVPGRHAPIPEWDAIRGPVASPNDGVRRTKGEERQRLRGDVPFRRARARRVRGDARGGQLGRAARHPHVAWTAPRAEGAGTRDRRPGGRRRRRRKDRLVCSAGVAGPPGALPHVPRAALRRAVHAGPFGARPRDPSGTNARSSGERALRDGRSPLPRHGPASPPGCAREPVLDGPRRSA